MIAFALGYLAMLIFDDQNAVWILITIAVVMSSQPVVGQLMQKSVFRMLGTVVGLLFGMLTFVLPHNDIVIFCMVVMVSFFMAYFFAFRTEAVGQVGVLGMVTFSLVTFLAHGSLHFAMMRLLDTFIGISISLFVSFFIFPMTSKRTAMLTLTSICNNLHLFVEKVFVENLDRRTDPKINKVENAIIQDLTKLRNAIRTSRFDTFGAAPSQRAQLNNFIRYLRAIYHYLLFMDVAISEIAEINTQLAEEVKTILHPKMKKLDAIFAEAVSNKPSFSRRLYYKPLDSSVFDEQFKSQYYAIDFALRRIPFCLNKIEVARRMMQVV